MLLDILNTFNVVTGYTLYNKDGITFNSASLDYINRAAKDLYNSLETDLLMREVVLIVPQDQQLSIPPFMGELRAMREYRWSGTIPLFEIGVPRYTSDTWKYKWRNWTYKGKRALASNLASAGVLQFTVPTIESPNVIISIVGRTANSGRIQENVTINAFATNTLNSFASIESIVCPTPRQYDIQIFDANANPLATLFNNEQKTSYLIIDVSRYDWSAWLGDGQTSLVETLYKAKFYKLFNAADEFPADGYDDAIAYGALELWYQGQEGKEQDAILFRVKAKSVVDSNVSSTEIGQVRRMANEKNPTYNIFKRMRYSFNWRRTTWSN